MKVKVNIDEKIDENIHRPYIVYLMPHIVKIYSIFN